MQLEETNSNLEKCQEDSKKQLDEVKASLEDRESVVRNLEQCISELRSTSARDQVQIEQLKEEAEILRQNLENVSRDKIATKVELEGQLRTCENELIRYKEQYNLLQKDFEVFGKETREKISELESRNEKLKHRFETKEEEALVISELLESAGINLYKWSFSYWFPSIFAYISENFKLRIRMPKPLMIKKISLVICSF